MGDVLAPMAVPLALYCVCVGPAAEYGVQSIKKPLPLTTFYKVTTAKVFIFQKASEY